MNDARERLGQAIATARTAAGLTQGALGAATGLGQTAVSRIEAGLRKVEFLELVTIAAELGVDVADLAEAAAPATRATTRDVPDYQLVALRLADENPAQARALEPATSLLAAVHDLNRRLADADQHR